MEKRVCCDCNLELSINDFPILKNANGKERYSIRCRKCYNFKASERNKKSYIKHRVERTEKQREWNKNNIEKRKEYKKNIPKDKIKEQQKKKYEKNKEKYLSDAKLYYQKNREKIIKQKIEYERNRKLIDPLFKLKKNISTLIRQKLIKNKYTKKSKTYQILGCSFEEFKIYIESKFESWMTWDNYGLYNGTPEYGWDIDHIIPTSKGNDENEIINLNHYTNLQPLCSYINRDVKRDIA